MLSFAVQMHPFAFSRGGSRDSGSAFTLIELLASIAIIAILAALVIQFAPGLVRRAEQAKSLANMRQIGAGFQLYANDHDMEAPSRVKTGDKWPKLIFDYLSDSRVYADPSDAENILKRRDRDPLNNGVNNSSYLMNGFNQLGAYATDGISVRINSLEAPGQTILLGIQKGHNNFYMDTEEGNQNSAVNKEAYNGGSHYLFADGSVRFLKNNGDYSDALWDVQKETQTQ